MLKLVSWNASHTFVRPVHTWNRRHISSVTFNTAESKYVIRSRQSARSDVTNDRCQRRVGSRRDVRLKLDILFVVCVLVSSHGLASAQAPTRDPIQLLIEYRHLIDAYRHGGVDEIARDLKRWDPRRINETISVLATERKSDPFLLDTRVGLPGIGG